MHDGEASDRLPVVHPGSSARYLSNLFIAFWYVLTTAVM